MCGRFTLRTPAALWGQLFLPEMRPEEIAIDDPSRYNIAPTQQVACVLRESTGEPRKAERLRWGLVPPWAKELAIGNRMINARGETVDSKPSFRNAFRSRRCLIPADGFFEWQKVDGGKQPFLIESAAGGVFALAGLWEENQKVATQNQPVRSFTIITTVANRMMSQLHDRMPVLLDPEDFDCWLDPGYRDSQALKELLVPVADDQLRMTAVSRRVNSPRYDDAECVKPIEDYLRDA